MSKPPPPYMGDIREPPTLPSESTGERNEQNASNIRVTLDTDKIQALTAGNHHQDATTAAALEAFHLPRSDSTAAAQPSTSPERDGSTQETLEPNNETNTQEQPPAQTQPTNGETNESPQIGKSNSYDAPPMPQPNTSSNTHQYDSRVVTQILKDHRKDIERIIRELINDEPELIENVAEHCDLARASTMNALSDHVDIRIDNSMEDLDFLRRDVEQLITLIRDEKQLETLVRGVVQRIVDSGIIATQVKESIYGSLRKALTSPPMIIAIANTLLNYDTLRPALHKLITDLAPGIVKKETDAALLELRI